MSFSIDVNSNMVCCQKEGSMEKFPHAFRTPCLALDPCSHHHTTTWIHTIKNKKKSLTLVAMTLGDTNDVDHLVLAEHIVDGNSLFQFLPGPVHLLGDGATVQLDLHQVGLLLPQGQQAHLKRGGEAR